MDRFRSIHVAGNPDVSGNFQVGNQHYLGGGILIIRNACTYPTTRIPDAGGIFASGGERCAYGAAGNATQISRHDAGMRAWVFYSRQIKTEPVVHIYPERMIRVLEMVTGEQFSRNGLRITGVNYQT